MTDSLLKEFEVAYQCIKGHFIVKEVINDILSEVQSIVATKKWKKNLHVESELQKEKAKLDHDKAAFAKLQVQEISKAKVRENVANSLKADGVTHNLTFTYYDTK